MSDSQECNEPSETVKVNPSKFSKYSSRIKDIYLALPDFQYFHSPSGLTNDYERFVGREHLLKKLDNILNEAETKAGAYLITGYRGVGKTSLIRKVLYNHRLIKTDDSQFWVKAVLKIIGLIAITFVFIHLYFIACKYLSKVIGKVIGNSPIDPSLWEDLNRYIDGFGFTIFQFGLFWTVITVFFVLTSTLLFQWIALLEDKWTRVDFRKSGLAKFFGKKKSVVIESSLAQSELKDLDILQLLTKNFYDHYKVELRPLKSFANLFHFLLKIILGLCVFLITIHVFYSYKSIDILGLQIDPVWSGLTVGVFLTFLMFKYYPYFLGLIFITPESVLKKLADLNEMVKGNVTTESGSTSETGILKSKFSFARKKTRAYPQATARTIEAELVTILRLSSEVSWPFRRLDFVFIFDELDKIEVHGSTDTNASFEEQNNFGPEYSRKRQESIALLLGNLKHFLNVARAKFFFISSREMYDVFLSDISDRDGYVGSVFHDVINVPSFFTESYTESSTDITRLTEEYVCQFLIPLKWMGSHSSKTKANLQVFKKYLSDADSFTKLNGLPDWERNAIKQKIIFTLRQFIIYLVYRSNGAPKSVTRLFESFIRHPNLKDHREGNELRDTFSYVVCAKYEDDRDVENMETFYLHFDVLQQYKFGFTNYIFTQFLVAKSKYMREFGDKLLVSAAYLLDHLYKFHNVAFSWHHLEQTPEMLDINKSPALRGFMEEMVRSLSNIHVREIVSGLYQFKFYKRIANEIDFISKISEMESAAFNFTLDEHLQIKRYYQVKLKDFQKNLSDAYSGNSSGKSLYSLAELHMTLGDLHFYDQEFEEAKRHFTDAIRILKGQSPVESTNVHQFMLMLRNQLKLGLAHEKTQSFGAATAEYGNVSLDVTRWRDLEYQHLGLVKAVVHVEEIPELIDRFSAVLGDFFHRQLKESEEDQELRNKRFKTYNDYDGITNDDELKQLGVSKRDQQIFRFIKMVSIRRSKPLKADFFYLLYKVKRLFGKRETMTFYGWPKEKTKAKYKDGYYSLKGIERFHSFSRFFMLSLEKISASSEKEAVYMKKIVFESFRLVYQPLIAKLHAIEKGSMGGVTYSDLKRNIKEFEYLSRAAWHDEKHLLEAEYYNKVGNLLFYKNGHAFGQYDDNNQRQSYTEILQINQLFKYKITKDFKAPIAAYQFYRNSLEILRRRVIEYEEGHISWWNEAKFDLVKEREMLVTYLRFLEAKELKFPSIQNTLMESIGNSFSDLGNTILASIGKSGGDFIGPLLVPNENSIGMSFLEVLLGKSSGDTIKSKDERLRDIQEFLGYSRSNIKSISGTVGTKAVPRLEIALLCFCISSMYFQRANRHRKYVFQNLKVLYVLKDHFTELKTLNHTVPSEFNDLVSLLERGLLSKVLRAIHRTNDNSVRFEIEYYKQIFKDEIKKGEHEIYRAILNNVSNTPEVREALVLFSELKFVIEGQHLPLPNSFLLNAYSGINSQYTRALELKYKSHINEHYFRKFFDIDFSNAEGLRMILQKILEESGSNIGLGLIIDFIERNANLVTSHPLTHKLKKLKNDLRNMSNKYQAETSIITFLHSNKDELFESLSRNQVYLLSLQATTFEKLSGELSENEKKYFDKHTDATVATLLYHLITDSINCLNEVINSFKVYGISYMVTHSRIGFTHLSLAKWCERYQVLVNDCGVGRVEDSQKYFTRLLESNANISVVPSYHYEQALKHFYASLQVHNEGDGYKSKLYNMYYLEDDFNDNLYHFGAAIERYKINTGVIRSKIQECQRMLKVARQGKEKETAMDIYDYAKYAM
ncbi:MAG: hypothetical protein Roseis2KO_33620 [Roseivirga sp.]